jgi:hypothetical protein
MTRHPRAAPLRSNPNSGSVRWSDNLPDSWTDDPDEEKEHTVGLFTRDATGPDSVLAPLTAARVEAILKKEGYYYFIDSEGDLGSHWGDHTFYFFFYGESKEMFQIRGRWHRKVDSAWLYEVVTAANDWNTTKLYPKAYVRNNDDEIGVYGEHTVDYEHGVSDEQLLLHIHCAVQTTLAFFEVLDEKFPQVATPPE